jgi:hypothetical protein
MAEVLRKVVPAGVLFVAAALGPASAGMASGGNTLLVGVGGGAFSANPGPVFSPDPMGPGDSQVVDVRVRNGSSTAGGLTLAAAGITERGGIFGVAGPYGCGLSASLANQLIIGVRQVDGATNKLLYSGSLCSLQSSAISLLSVPLAVGSEEEYSFQVQLPPSASNNVEGVSLGWNFVWQLTASDGNTTTVIAPGLGSPGTSTTTTPDTSTTTTEAEAGDGSGGTSSGQGIGAPVTATGAPTEVLGSGQSATEPEPAHPSSVAPAPIGVVPLPAQGRTGGTLPFTGSEIGPALGSALLAVVAGSLLLLLQRRRR